MVRFWRRRSPWREGRNITPLFTRTEAPVFAHKLNNMPGCETCASESVFDVLKDLGADLVITPEGDVFDFNPKGGGSEPRPHSG